MDRNKKLEKILQKAKNQSTKNINQSKLNLSNEVFIELEVDTIDLNPYQPRKYFNEKTITELAESIKTYGLIQPIIVTKRENNYILIAGERRLRAVKTLNKNVIQARVKENVTDQELKEIALVENIQREDINIIDEAFAFKELSNNNLSLRNISNLTGKSKTHIARMLKICSLDKKVIEIVKDYNLNNPNILEILVNYTAEVQFKLINRLKDGNLSFKEVKNFKNNLKKRVSPEGTKSKYPFNLKNIEAVNMSKKKNTLNINIDLDSFNEKNLNTISKYILKIKNESKS